MDTEHYLKLLMQLSHGPEWNPGQEYWEPLAWTLSYGGISANRGCHGNRMVFSECFTGVGIFCCIGKEKQKESEGWEHEVNFVSLVNPFDKTKNFPQKFNVQPGDDQKAEFMVCDRMWFLKIRINKILEYFSILKCSIVNSMHSTFSGITCWARALPQLTHKHFLTLLFFMYSHDSTEIKFQIHISLLHQTWNCT